MNTPGQVSCSCRLLALAVASLCDCDWLIQYLPRPPLCPPGQVPAAVGRGSIGAAAPLGVSRDDDGGRYYSTKRGAFHEVFNLPESERPLTGGGGTAKDKIHRHKLFQIQTERLQTGKII